MNDEYTLFSYLCIYKYVYYLNNIFYSLPVKWKTNVHNISYYARTIDKLSDN